MSIDFKDKVAIVTGAGGGLGREYALELAKRGAKVVVNDLGGSRDGTGTSDAAAKVVEEIEKAGGEAIANGASVTEYDQMEKMIADAKQKWGGVHVLINNAGVLRDKSFAKMEPADFDFVVKVHLLGSANATKAAWETMREQAYGRVLMTASSTGLFGNFGQANYGAAKLGLAGRDERRGVAAGRAAHGRRLCRKLGQDQRLLEPEGSAERVRTVGRDPDRDAEGHRHRAKLGTRLTRQSSGVLTE